MAKVVEAFECDPDFCPNCGSILPLPGLLDVVTCSVCKYAKDTAGKQEAGVKGKFKDSVVDTLTAISSHFVGTRRPQIVFLGKIFFPLT